MSRRRSQKARQSYPVGGATSSREVGLTHRHVRETMAGGVGLDPVGSSSVVLFGEGKAA